MEIIQTLITGVFGILWPILFVLAILQLRKLRRELDLIYEELDRPKYVVREEAPIFDETARAVGFKQHEYSTHKPTAHLHNQEEDPQ